MEEESEKALLHAEVYLIDRYDYTRSAVGPWPKSTVWVSIGRVALFLCEESLARLHG